MADGISPVGTALSTRRWLVAVMLSGTGAAAVAMRRSVTERLVMSQVRLSRAPDAASPNREIESAPSRLKRQSPALGGASRQSAGGGGGWIGRDITTFGGA